MPATSTSSDRAMRSSLTPLLMARRIEGLVAARSGLTQCPPAPAGAGPSSKGRLGCSRPPRLGGASEPARRAGAWQSRPRPLQLSETAEGALLIGSVRRSPQRRGDETMSEPHDPDRTVDVPASAPADSL